MILVAVGESYLEKFFYAEVLLDQLADGFLHLTPDAALVPGAQVHDGLKGEVGHVLLPRVEIGQVGEELSSDLLCGKLGQDGS